MDLTWIRQQSWFASAQVSRDGIWTVKNGACAIGIVLLATKGSSVALARKAQKTGYEFSSSLVLPGGAIRSTCGETLLEALPQSLLRRVESESGLSGPHLQNVRLLCHRQLPITGYTAKGKERRTLVLSARAEVEEDCRLRSSDKTVSDVQWWTAPFPWSNLAPANCMILAMELAESISIDERRQGWHPVDDARKRCNAWARDVGFPELSHPWSSPSDVT